MIADEHDERAFRPACLGKPMLPPVGSFQIELRSLPSDLW
jgi:hypothetical protein